MPDAPSEEADPQAQLKVKAVEFVMALCTPTMSDRDVAWHGVLAAIEASKFSQAPHTGYLHAAVERLQKLVGA